jgi:hypothetical protein
MAGTFLQRAVALQNEREGWLCLALGPTAGSERPLMLSEKLSAASPQAR